MDKPFWRSKTFWGAVIAAAPVPGAPLIAAAVSALPAATETVAAVPADGDPVVQAVQAIISFSGAVLAIYGRSQAGGSITLK